MKQLLNRIFAKKSINGCGETVLEKQAKDHYMHRWRLLSLPKGRKIYLHHFYGNDWSGDFHDHPKRFISIGLWGSYVEHYLRHLEGSRHPSFKYSVDRSPVATHRLEKEYKAPWFRIFHPEHTHRVDCAKSCWTLVYVGPHVRHWGFHRRGKWLPYRVYLKLYGGEDCK